MKKIEAIIRRTKFEEVKEALLAADIEWFSYYEVRGVGKTREGRIYRGVVYDQFHRTNPDFHRSKGKECGKDRTGHHESRLYR